MKQDNQTKQLIILGALAVLLVGYLAYTFLGHGSDKTVKATATKTRTPAQQASLTGQENVLETAVPNAVFPGLSTPSPRRDPFSVQYVPAPQVKVETSKPRAQLKLPSAMFAPVQPFNPFKAQAALPLPDQNQKIEIVAPERPSLSGVLLGPNNIAVLRYEGKSYVVNEGSYFAGSYRLLRVTKSGVVLQNKGTLIRISLGGLR